MTAARADRTAHSASWNRLRKHWAPIVTAGGINCARCGLPIDPHTPWDLGHDLPWSHGGSDADARPEHRECNRRAKDTPRGGPVFLEAGGANGSAMGENPSESESAGIGPDAPDPCWDRCEWLAELRNIPEDARWPRYMTGPHPAATGSYGAGAVEWLAGEAGIVLLWWQRLVVYRLLEYDAAGVLVWRSVLLTVARQVGKSTLLRALALWRMHRADLFGEPQTVLHTARDLQIMRDTQRSAKAWARSRRAAGYRVVESNGREEVSGPDGGRWLLRATRGVYGYSASLALADEAWGIAADVIDDGMAPTMLARLQPQLVLASTAHPQSTSLFLARRAAALGELDSPGSALLIEWSAAADPGDESGWRAASPWWSADREDLIRTALAATRSAPLPVVGEPDPVESFRAQYLNVWPARSAAQSAATVVPLVDGQVWAGAADLRVPVPAGPVVLAVDDWGGAGAAALVAARLGDGRVLVSGQLFESRARAAAWVAWQVSAHAGSRLLVGAQLLRDAAIAALGEVERMGAADTSAGLPMLRELVVAGRLVHDGGRDLTGQVGAARVTASRAGGLILSPRSGRSDLLRCAAWAVAAAAELPAAQVPDFFVF